MRYITFFFLLLFHLAYGSAPVENGRLIGKLDLGYLPMAIAQKGDIVYIAGFDSARLYLYDISDPKKIRFLKSMGVAHGTITDIHIDHQRMYLAQGSEGVAILDIGDPRNPRVVKTAETGREYWDIFGKSLMDKGYSIGEEYVYAVDNKSGVVDIFDKDLHRIKSIAVPASERHERVFVEESFSLTSDGTMVLAGRYLFVTGEETGVSVYYFDGSGFDKMHKIYENKNLSLSGMSTDTVLTIESGDKKYVFEAAYLLFDPDPFIVFGTRTFKLSVYAHNTDHGFDGGGRIEEIKDGDYSVNTSGFVSNNYRHFVAGNYRFAFFEYVRDGYQLDKTLKTDCFGSFVATDKELICANKNTQSLEIYTLERRPPKPRKNLVPIMIDDFMTMVPSVQ